MKFIKAIFGMSLICCCLSLKAQEINWKNLEENQKHIIQANIGWDYSLSFGLGYKYRVNPGQPLLIGGSFSFPSGKTLFDDFKVKLGGQYRLIEKDHFIASLSLYGIYRRYESDLVRLQNVGSEISGDFGYYKPKWFAAVEVGFDKAIVTHFKHSDIYNEFIYEAKNGWYEPPTGGNFFYGLKAGYSFPSSDLTFSIGQVLTEKFNTTPLIPYYTKLGYSRKF